MDLRFKILNEKNKYMEDEIKTLKQKLENEQKFVKKISEENVKNSYNEGIINIKDLEILKE